MNMFSNLFSFYLKVQSFRLIMENNFIQMAASAGHAVAYIIGSILRHISRLCVAVFHQWLHEFCPLKPQLSLACRRKTYLSRHCTNNSPSVSNRSFEVAKQLQLCG